MNTAKPKISVIIPVLNEQDAIGLVISDIPKDVTDEIIVVDNGSTDNTAMVAEKAGVRVVHEDRRGYGAACLKGIASVNDPDIIVFLDGDYSDYPEEMARIVAPIVQGTADLVIGSRMLEAAANCSSSPRHTGGTGWQHFSSERCTVTVLPTWDRSELYAAAH